MKSDLARSRLRCVGNLSSESLIQEVASAPDSAMVSGNETVNGERLSKHVKKISHCT
jgi:hypothetical protein